MNSMTGFGKGIAEKGDRKITVELRSVNHRFLDIMFKLPRMLAFCEDTLRKTISANAVRGHIDVYCTYQDNRQGKTRVSTDYGVAEQYLSIGSELEKRGVVNDLTASQLLKMPEVLILQSGEDDENAILELVQIAAREACEQLLKMRKTEGEILLKDFEDKLDGIAVLCAEISERAPLVARNYAERLRERIAESLDNLNVDEARLLNEVAFFVDKSNIDEELTRLHSHVKHGREILHEKGAIGKKLDFLVQEMNREVNTTGAKSNDLLITEKVLKLKNEVEKIREQVQNIE